MRILFIGGNGTISAHSSRLAVEQGHELDAAEPRHELAPTADRGR